MLNNEGRAAIDLQNQLEYFAYKVHDIVDSAINALKLTKKLFDNSMEGIVLTDHNLRILQINKTFTEVTGHEFADVAGKTPSILQSGQHGEDFYKAMWEALKSTGIWQGQIFNRRKNGEIYPEWLSIYSIKNNNGDVINYIGLFSDLTEKKMTQNHIHQLAHYDPLTNLPNRLLFMERLKQSIVMARRKESSLAVFFLDLDGFKKINDSMGHASGDLLLQEVALRLRKYMRESDTVSRLGGDEFTVIIDGYNHLSDIIIIANKILKELALEVKLQERSVYITASIGISIYPDDGHDMGELIKNADTSMYAAKEKGKNRYEFYDLEMNRKILERLSLESYIHSAYNKEEFIVYYQPKINLHNHSIEGAEALIRWNHPSLGFIQPSKFIPLAEEIGMITSIGEWVLRQVCRDLKKWKEHKLKNIKVSVNLSTLQFRDKNLVKTLTTIILEEGVSVDSLEIEITEGMLMRDVQESIKMMKELKDMGLSLSIDDFGTGYSSLKYLKEFPIDTLKIDKSFIDEIPHNENNGMIVKSIIDLAHNLGMDVIAEGVEKREQIEFLMQNGCQKVQGFYFSQAIDADAFYTIVLKDQNEY